jgi:hypothetical protein
MRSAEQLDCKSLQAGCLIDVETASRHYRIECLGGSQIRISGHPQFCPTPVDAQVQGSITREGTFAKGMIERGSRLTFLIDEKLPVTTSLVLNLQFDQPNSPSSVHFAGAFPPYDAEPMDNSKETTMFPVRRPSR